MGSFIPGPTTPVYPEGEARPKNPNWAWRTFFICLQKHKKLRIIENCLTLIFVFIKKKVNMVAPRSVGIEVSFVTIDIDSLINNSLF